MLCRRCIKQKSKIKQKQNDVEKLQKEVNEAHLLLRRVFRFVVS